MIKSFFQFSRKERQGTILFIVGILFLALFPELIPYCFPPQVHNPEDLSYLLQQPISLADPAKERGSNKANMLSEAVGPIPKLHFFDPNQLDATEWAQLGLARRTIETILRYRERGGRFRQPADLKKIYGLREQEVSRLLPFVKIATTQHTRFSDTSAMVHHPAQKFSPGITPKKPLPIDINAADSLLWVQLPGIGPGYARRIIRYREKLGGFYTVSQVAETYGLPDSTFSIIQSLLSCQPVALTQLSINAASEEDLSRHPYISRKLAREIVSYRVQHGSFQGPESLAVLVTLEKDALKKIIPYISF